MSVAAKSLRLASAITALTVILGAGFAVAGVVAPQFVLPHEAVTNGSFVFALYAAARAVPLAVVTLAAIARRSASALIVLGALAGVIQLGDAAIGVVQSDAGKTLGPLVVAALQLYAVLALRRSASATA